MSARTSLEEDSLGGPPAAMLLGISSAIRIERALWVVARLGVADHIESAADRSPNPIATPSVSIDDLADAVGADRDCLHRVLRALTSMGIFAEVAPGRFAGTRLSGPLRSSAPDSVREAILQQGDTREWAAWGGILDTLRTGQPAYERVWGESPWASYADTRARMTQVSRADSIALADHPLFAGFGHLVDVGGGEGDFLAAVLQANPGSRGTLLDLPAVMENAPSLFAARGVADRCEAIAGDMFVAVPPGGDLYLLKRVLHDWDDERAVAILRSVRRAINGRGRLVVLTALLPEDDTASSARLGDIALMVMLGGRHRTESELRGLLEAAGFLTVGVVVLPSPMSAVVAVPA